MDIISRLSEIPNHFNNQNNMKTEPKMTKYAHDLLAYRGYTPRGLEALQRALANTWANQPKEESEKPQSGVEGICWCMRERRWLVYLNHRGVRKWCGQRAELDDAIRLQNSHRAALGI
jgi:hypothetical protein